MTRPEAPRGFALIEALIALVAVAIIGASLVGLTVSQSNFANHQDARRNARAASYGALNMLMSEMRMVEPAGGIVSADSQRVEVRIPVSMGLVCGSSAGATTLSLLPTDSATLAEAVPSGYAVRTAAYAYVEPITLAAGTAANCLADSVRVVSGGRLVDVSPATAAPAGSPAFVYSTLRYELKESVILPGRFALWRTVVATDAAEEISLPLDSTSVFRFFEADADSAQAAPPADLSDLTGLEFHLVGESERAARGQTDPTRFELDAAVRFMNRRR